MYYFPLLVQVYFPIYLEAVSIKSGRSVFLSVEASTAPLLLYTILFSITSGGQIKKTVQYQRTIIGKNVFCQQTQENLQT